VRRYATFVVLIIGLALVATACSDDDGGVNVSGSNTSVADATTTVPTTTATSGSTQPVDADVTATIRTNMGEMVLAIDTKNAPKAAGRFVELAKDGFYDGLTFHRVVPDFVIQGGDPEGTGAGGTNESVVGETPTDGYPLGSLAAAKTQLDPAGTFDCQFFIVTGPNGTTLDPEYARFGMLISGMDVAKKIEGLAPPGNPQGGEPTEKVTIETITITQR
jgi:cyclophilin family peptidyl-prolyl cis-trans isomerase